MLTINYREHDADVQVTLDADNYMSPEDAASAAHAFLSAMRAKQQAED